MDSPYATLIVVWTVVDVRLIAVLSAVVVFAALLYHKRFLAF